MRALLIFMVALCLPATAQRELWRWKTPNGADPAIVSAIHAISSDAKGNTAVVIGECTPLDDFPWTKDCRFRLVWISSAGKKLHEETVDVGVRSGANMVTPGSWSVINVSAASWIVTDGETIYMCRIKGKAVSTSKKVLGEDNIAFAANPGQSFNGWFEQKVGRRGSFNTPWQQPAPFATPDEISLWVP